LAVTGAPESSMIEAQRRALGTTCDMGGSQDCSLKVSSALA